MKPYRLIKSGYFDDGEVASPFEFILGEYDTIEEAREAMEDDVLAVEEYNDYGKYPEDSESSYAVGENGHHYEFNDCTGSYIDWTIESNEQA